MSSVVKYCCRNDIISLRLYETRSVLALVDNIIVVMENMTNNLSKRVLSCKCWYKYGLIMRLAFYNQSPPFLSVGYCRQFGHETIIICTELGNIVIYCYFILGQNPQVSSLNVKMTDILRSNCGDET